MEKVHIQLALIAGLLKLQTENWERRIRYEIRFFLCGIFTYLSFAILKQLGDLIVGREDNIIEYIFDNPPFAVLILISTLIGYVGLYFSILAGALYTSLLPKA